MRFSLRSSSPIRTAMRKKPDLSHRLVRRKPARQRPTASSSAPPYATCPSTYSPVRIATLTPVDTRSSAPTRLNRAPARIPRRRPSSTFRRQSPRHAAHPRSCRRPESASTESMSGTLTTFRSSKAAPTRAIRGIVTPLSSGSRTFRTTPPNRTGLAHRAHQHRGRSALRVPPSRDAACSSTWTAPRPRRPPCHWPTPGTHVLQCGPYLQAPNQRVHEGRSELAGRERPHGHYGPSILSARAIRRRSGTGYVCDLQAVIADPEGLDANGKPAPCPWRAGRLR